jgi:hypothetical protein
MFSKLAVSFAAFLSLVNLSIQYTNITITSGGVARWFLVMLPPKFDPWFPTPVILSYHGGVLGRVLCEGRANSLNLAIPHQNQLESHDSIIH